MNAAPSTFRPSLPALALLSIFIAVPSLADGVGFHGGDDLYQRDQFEVGVDGYARVRGELRDNFDLDRGLTPSGRPFYPVPADNGQVLPSADLRIRTDLALYAPFAAAAIKFRADLVDNYTIGSTPILSNGSGTIPTASASLTGELPNTLLRIKRAYAEWLTPFGYLAAGRMGNHWGLGMLTNDGDCLDCDHGDAADRIAFATPLVGHIFAVAYDFDAIGPLSTAPTLQHPLLLEPQSNVQSFSFAVLNPRSPLALERRRRAGKYSFEYGLLASYRWQPTDIPATYLDPDIAITPSQVVPRGFQAVVVDVWLKLTAPWGRLEAEGALAYATIAQGSLIPGVLLRDPYTSLQWGGAAELELGTPTSRFSAGVHTGIASGDPAPGFGAFPQAGVKPVAGELDAPQIDPPRDTRIDNLRFNPDYKIDRILFAEIIGTVTDTIYVQPFVQARLGTARLVAAQGAHLGHVHAGHLRELDARQRREPGARAAELASLGSGAWLRCAARVRRAVPLRRSVEPGRRARRHPRTAAAASPGLGVLKMRATVLSLVVTVALFGCGDNRTFPTRTDYETPTPTPLSCFPNLDGQIDDDEAKAALGIPESLLVSPAGTERTVNLDGTVDAQGHRIWDFSVDYADDQLAHVEATAIDGLWFAASFPGGVYVVPIDAGGTVLGIYSDDGSNLLLHGVASAEQNPAEGQTLLPLRNACRALPVPAHRREELGQRG